LDSIALSNRFVNLLYLVLHSVIIIVDTKYEDIVTNTIIPKKISKAYVK
jgi:hypothetical protein